MQPVLCGTADARLFAGIENVQIVDANGFHIG
jgi:hypothetical protein